jgi:hypothetical protein
LVVHRGRLHWPGDAALPDAPPVAGPGLFERWRNTILLITVGLYLLFNYGFMQVRIPPVAGGGLPVGEIVLMLTLLTMNFTGVLGRLGTTVALLPLAMWWAFGVSRALFDFALHGAWALRDAAHVVESMFLLAGFVFASHPRTVERFYAWLPRLLIVCVLYGLLLPVQRDIYLLSPTITSGTGYDTPLFGSMLTTPFLQITAAFYLLIFHGRRLSANLGAVAVIGYTVAMYQQRTLYLVLMALFAFVLLYRRSSAGNLGFVVYVSAIGLALIALLGLQFQGRLGASFDFNFLVHHFLAIFGIGSSEYEGVTSAAQGVDQRLDWWTGIFQRMLADPFHLLLGLGYGVPLTDFHGGSGAIVREPHNSYVSVIARTGIIGAVCWVLIVLGLLRRWHRTFLRCRELGWRLGENRLMILMVYFICMFVLAIGEDGFEKPYNVIPFYFFWGVVLRFAYLLERGEIGPEAEDDGSPEPAPEGSSPPRGR